MTEWMTRDFCQIIESKNSQTCTKWEQEADYLVHSDRCFLFFHNSLLQHRKRYLTGGSGLKVNVSHASVDGSYKVIVVRSCEGLVELLYFCVYFPLNWITSSSYFSSSELINVTWERKLNINISCLERRWCRRNRAFAHITLHNVFGQTASSTSSSGRGRSTVLWLLMQLLPFYRVSALWGTELNNLTCKCKLARPHSFGHNVLCASWSFLSLGNVAEKWLLTWHVVWSCTNWFPQSYSTVRHEQYSNSDYSRRAEAQETV